jgi:formylglycine-generating enzyme required for sulfatase activity
VGCENLPVTAVTFDDAEAYARWAGKRLPTAEEWEAAAGGTDSRGFPWGDKAERDAANINTLGLAAVGSFERDESPFGCRDMAGNAAEWVASRDQNGRIISARKGAAFYTPFQYPVAYLAYGAIPLKPGEKLDELGFRCVKDAPPGEDRR